MFRISHKPLTFSENNRFNETNWVIFKNLVTMTAKIRGTMGYLDNLIKKTNHINQTSQTSQPKQTNYKT